MANTASDVRVTLYKPRQSFLRLDVAPFAVIYALFHAHAWASLMNGAISYETLACIPVALAAHLLLFLSTRWSVKIRCWVAFRTCDDKDATHALAWSSTAALCELKEEAPRGRFFSFQRRIYVQDVSGWRPHAPKTQRPLAELAQCPGLETNEARNNAKEELGPQRFPDRGPDLFGIVRGALPGAVLRLPGLLLCLVELDEYWVYSAFTLVMLLLFEATLCIQRLRNLEQLRSMRRPARLLYATDKKSGGPRHVRRPRARRCHRSLFYSKAEGPRSRCPATVCC